jgi:hypothetical protein
MYGFGWLWRLARLPAMALLILTTPISATDAAERRFCLFEATIAGTGAGFVCEQPSARAAVVDTSCSAFAPIRYSRHDTDGTQRQSREHNAAWDALCKRRAEAK